MNTLVILAAGQGSRLRPLTDSLPKCLLEVGGRSILDRLLPHFAGWAERTVVVTGFESEQVEHHLAGLKVPGSLQLCRNPDFAETNSCYSAWLARESWHDAGGLALTNADVLFRREALAGLLQQPDDLALSVRGGSCDTEDMKVALDPEGRVNRVSKEIAPDASAGEFTGVSLARGAGVAVLLSAMETLLNEPGMRAGAWYDQALDAIARREGVGFVPVPPDSYWEVDTFQDLSEVRDSGVFGDAEEPG